MLLFDTGYEYGNLKETIRSIIELPLIVVNSHGHFDHVCGDFQFSDNPIYIHERNMEICKKYNTKE